jgi:TaqI-like C-terminal specificity domain
VFERSGAYTILVVLQRRASEKLADSPPAQIAHVVGSIGAALQACLDGTNVKTEYYRVYEVAQSFFRAKTWILVSPEELSFSSRLASLPRLSDFAIVRQGFVTGSDDVFIIPKRMVPKGEEHVYIDYLPDREIARYRLPEKTDEVVFYPYDDGDDVLEPNVLANRYPETWTYLLSHKERLEARKSVMSGSLGWWRPERPREPSMLLRPKIVGPHLMLTPRFAVDTRGRFAVSRSPFVIARDSGEDLVILRFLCAVLNSSVCNWYVRTYAPKYSRGYSRLEVAMLKDVPVPNIARTASLQLIPVVTAVEHLERSPNTALDEETDIRIAELYGFSREERRTLLGIA